MIVGIDQKSQLAELNFFVDGVRCSKCVHKLENLNFEHSEITGSRFNKARSVLTLETSESLSPESAIQLIESKGYKAFFIESSKDSENRRQITHRNWLTRLVVTFFFASNLMMFAFAIYLGASKEWQRLFSWLCGLLFLPIVFYSAIPFYQSAWQALKDKRFSADLAIVIAFVWGSLLSYANLLSGNSNFYFDSTASFLFLILLARYLLDRAQNSIESELNPSLLFKTSPLFEVSSAGIMKKVYYHQILKDSHLHLKQSQTLPVDIILLSDSADMDTSLFSGESLPQTFYKGDILKSGTLVMTPNIEGIALGTFQDSELNKIFEGVIRNRHEKTKANAQAEVYSHRLLTIVSILSIGVLLAFGLQSEWAEGFRRALSLFTIACPCALALAIPLASVITLKRGMELGLFVKSPLFFERLQNINGIVFDKTGTLTIGQMDFHSWDPPIPNNFHLQLLLAMELNSSHPIAKSLCRILREQKIEAIPIECWKETPGVGVEAQHLGLTYKISRITNSNQKALTGFELTLNKEVLLTAYFKDQIRSEAPNLIKILRQNNYEVHLLSGDRQDVVDSIAKELNLAKYHYKSEMTPQEKAHFLELESSQKNKKYLMVGDGHNDALALSKASASIAVHGCAETSLRAADAYSQSNNLNIVLSAINLGNFYHRLIKQNVFLSLTYNLIAGTLALSGHVDPLMAAILMPINSFIVIGATVLARPKEIKEF